MSHQSRTKHRRPRRQVRRAFTLLEIIVVVTIIALLATLVVPRVWQHVGGSKQKIAYTNATSIANNLQIYLVDHNLSTVPSDLELTVLTEGDGALLDPEAIIDPWQRPYILVVPGTGGRPFDIVSYGADGEPGGEGENKDVNSSVRP